MFLLVNKDLFADLYVLHLTEKHENFFIVDSLFRGSHLLLMARSLSYVVGKVATITISCFSCHQFINITGIIIAALAHFCCRAFPSHWDNGQFPRFQVLDICVPGGNTHFSNSWGCNDEK